MRVIAGVPDVLRGHPCVGLPPRLSSAVVLPECADVASRDRGVQLHVSAIESIDRILQASDGESRLLLEVRDAAFHEQGDRVGPWHALVGDAPGTIARNRQKSSLLSVRSRHGQRTARSQIERFDPHDLHAADTTGEV